MTIIIHDTGNEWSIEDRSSSMGGADFLASYKTQSKAIQKARNKWAAPGQPIKIAGLNSRVVREGSKDWKGSNNKSSNPFANLFK